MARSLRRLFANCLEIAREFIFSRRALRGVERIGSARGGQFLNKKRTRAREKRKSRNNSREEFSRELLASRPRINCELREDQLRKMVDRARGIIAGQRAWLIGRE